MSVFTKLSEANVNHYNAHPTRHTVLTITAIVAIRVGMNYAIRKSFERAYTKGL